MPVLALIGHGAAVGDAVLQAFLDANYSVAILARNQQRLDNVAAAENAKGRKVKGYSVDLEKPETIAGVLASVAKDLGPIDVAVYNATYFHKGLEGSVEDFHKSANVGIVSLHASLAALLPAWKEAKKGTFLITGGALCEVPDLASQWGFPVSGAVKAYDKYFAASANASLKAENIHVSCIIVGGLIYGNELYPAAAEGKDDSAFRKQVGDAFVQQAQAQGDDRKANVFVKSADFDQIIGSKQ